MISVCVATYNGEKYLKEQLDSILMQLSEDDEVIVSDDGSTDSTLEILAEYGERVKILKNEQKGIVSNIENALNQAKGDIIFLSDQDDVWLPNKVETCVKELKVADLVVSDCFVTDKNLNIAHHSFFKKNNSFQNKFLALMKNSYLGCCMAFNRAVLDLALPFPKDIPMHDIWIGNVAGFNFKTKFISEPLIYYRRHYKNNSTASEKTKNNIFKIFSLRYSIIKNLLKYHR